MAWKWVNWASRVTGGLKSAEKNMLREIANQANPEGICNWSPKYNCSSEYLATKCGFTRQRADVILKSLKVYGLIFIEPKYPGTGNPTRQFRLNVTIIPEQFQVPRMHLPRGVGSRSRIMLTAEESETFQSKVRMAFQGYEEVEYFLEWIVPCLKLIGVRKNNLRCHIPGPEFQQKFMACEQRILAIAKAEISPQIRHLRTWFTRPKFVPSLKADPPLKSAPKTGISVDSAFTH